MLEAKLPGKMAHKIMLPPERDIELPSGFESVAKPSGVLLVLFPAENQLCTALIKRPAHMKYHAGQIGLPGGKLEPTDSNPLEAAIRETFEEVGLHQNSLEVLGKLSPLYLSVTNYLIYPYIGWCSQLPQFNINLEEADKLLVIPLESLNRDNIRYQTLETQSGPLIVPGFEASGEFVWGATAMILAEFMWLAEKDNLFGKKVGIVSEM